MRKVEKRAVRDRREKAERVRAICYAADFENVGRDHKPTMSLDEKVKKK